MKNIDQVIKQSQDGQLEAFTALFHHFKDEVYDLACAIMRDEVIAEDIVQETFLAVLNKIDGFKGEAAFSTWLKAIVINQCRMRLRKKRVRAVFNLDNLAPRELFRLSRQDMKVDDAVEDLIQKENIWDLVDRLQDHLRIPLILRYRYGLSCQEIAQIMESRLSTVYGQLHDGRKQLKELVTREQSAA